MASGPITSWQIDGETVEAVRDCILGAPKSLHMVTLEIKRRLLLGRKAMTNLHSILKSRDITLQTKAISTVVTYGCEYWTVKKSEKQSEELMLLNCGVGAVL